MRRFVPLNSTSKRTTASAATTVRAAFPPQVSVQRSQWHSPVPYLFGGLAAMLGLIAFALLILACSYWKLSGARCIRESGRRLRRQCCAGFRREVFGYNGW
ncbi:hypothetical protein OROGR_001509 [Orobanche gracilis]